MKPEIANQPIIKALCAIFDEDSSSILCQFDQSKKDFLRLPGGKVKWGETTEDCIRRELTVEEFGFKFKNLSPWIFCENFFNFEDSLQHEILFIFSANLETSKIEFPLRHNFEVEILIDWFEIAALSEFEIVPKGIKTILDSNRKGFHYYSNFEN